MLLQANQSQWAIPPPHDLLVPAADRALEVDAPGVGRRVEVQRAEGNLDLKRPPVGPLPELRVEPRLTPLFNWPSLVDEPTRRQPTRNAGGYGLVEVLVRERAEERDDIMHLAVAHVVHAPKAATQPRRAAVIPSPASVDDVGILGASIVVEAKHIIQRCEHTVVHVRGGQGHVT